MKRFTLLLAVLALLGMVTTANADNITGAWKTITIDGSSADWSSSDIMYPDAQIGDGLPLTTTYSTIYVCNDADNLYVGLATKGTGGASIMNACTRNLYFDNDMDSNTGFDSGWMFGGYDRLIEYGAGGGAYSVHEFTGATQAEWSWGWLSLITYSYSDSFIEWSIPRNQLNVSNGQARLEFHVTGGDVTVETWAYSWEGAVSTFTFGVPEPSVIGMALLGALALVRRK